MSKSAKLCHLSKNSCLASSDFYINDSHVDVTFPLHAHDFFEIDFVIAGKGESNIDGQICKLTKKQVVIIPPTHFHDYTVINKNSLSLINFAFHISSLHTDAAATISYATPLIFTLNDFDFNYLTDMCTVAMEKKRQKHPSADFYIKTCIEWILMQNIQNEPTHIINSGKRNVDFFKALEYINSNISDPDMNRDNVAKILNYSPSYFSKYFHREVGIPFQEYLLTRRLSYAHELLKNSNKPVSEIAFMSGFSSYSHFTKKYKARYGMLPSTTKQTQ